MRNWEKYLQLVKERPGLFSGNGLVVVLDEKTIKEFEENSGREIGVLCESPWRYVLVDLVRDADGRLFAFERIVPVRSGGVAILPIYDGKVVLIREYRHPVAKWCWEIPRGFGEPAASALDNAKKELFEETGIKRAEFVHLGQLMPESGLMSDRVDVFIADVKELNCTTLNKEANEVINSVRLFGLDELKAMVKSGEIADSYTLAAIGIWQLQ